MSTHDTSDGNSRVPFPWGGSSHDHDGRRVEKVIKEPPAIANLGPSIAERPLLQAQKPRRVSAPIKIKYTLPLRTGCLSSKSSIQ